MSTSSGSADIKANEARLRELLGHAVDASAPGLAALGQVRAGRSVEEALAHALGTPPRWPNGVQPEEVYLSTVMWPRQQSRLDDGEIVIELTAVYEFRSYPPAVALRASEGSRG